MGGRWGGGGRSIWTGRQRRKQGCGFIPRPYPFNYTLLLCSESAAAQVASEPTAAAACGGGVADCGPPHRSAAPVPSPAVIITNRLMRGLRGLPYSYALYWLISHLRHTSAYFGSSSSSASCASRDAVMRVWRKRVEETRCDAWETLSRSFSSRTFKSLGDRC